MGYCFGILTIIGARMVGNCAIFTEVRESELDLIRFDNRSSFAWRMSYGNWAKANIIWSKFRSINGFIL
jgi:hypothetical protein